ncbi:MAG: hypothetical protein ACYSUI_09425 [Planctomycetota bacterium]|jgi:hypothetical protein
MKTRSFCLLVALSLTVSPAWAQFDSGSDGSDGPLDITTNTVIDLSQAASMCDCDEGGVLDDDCRWDCPSPVLGQGVYDAVQWAVVFKYTTISIDAAATVTFLNHPKNPPVVWLATGDVTIDGVIILDGEAGGVENGTPFFSRPGPGGFSGGQNALPAEPESSAGFGPGGAPDVASGQSVFGSQASYGGPGFAGNCNTTPVGPSGLTYGNLPVFPLIGGSGASSSRGDAVGGGGSDGGGGGAGGGAILIATNTSITHNGDLRALGGDGGFGKGGGGSGGAIRLLARDSIAGQGSMQAFGGLLPGCGPPPSNPVGGDGRIRLEAPVITVPPSNPAFTTTVTPLAVFPDFATDAPKLWVADVDAVPVPADPFAGIATADVIIDTVGDSTITIQATNIPAGTTVQVRAVRERGPVVTATSTPLTDPGGGLPFEATATLALPGGATEIQLRANW